MRKMFFIAAVAVAALGPLSGAWAGVDAAKMMQQTVVDTDLFQEDIIEVQVLAGALFSPIASSASNRQTLDYAPVIGRLGWMLNTPSGEGFFRGNVEALIDLTVAPIFDGPGNIFVGPTALVRYNFVQPGWKFVPYIQGGAGILFTDAYKDYNQRMIGQVLEFSPQASVGFRYMIDRNWAFNAEAMFHHVSNAGLASRNIGINSVGGFIGVSYLFDRRSSK